MYFRVTEDSDLLAIEGIIRDVQEDNEEYNIQDFEERCNVENLNLENVEQFEF